LWCVNCQEWELFERPFKERELEKEDLVCGVCKNQFQDGLKYKDIPPDKLIEQRKRYKEGNRRDFQSMTMMMMSGGNDLFSNVSNDRIVEHDAGQDEIDKQIVENKVRVRKAEVEEFKKFAHLGRNDKCACGSDKKYKKCCEGRISHYRPNY
jgi:hypothetical protein